MIILLFQTLLIRVRAALNPAIVSQSEVDRLTDSVENQILVPDWFSQRTQLCYRWYPDGDGGQCGGIVNY